MQFWKAGVADRVPAAAVGAERPSVRRRRRRPAGSGRTAALAVGVALVTAALGAGPLVHADGALDAEMQAKTQQLGDIETRLDALQRELSDRRERRDALYAELERNERHIAALAVAGRQLTAMVEQQQAVVADLEGRLEATEEELSGARAELSQLLRSAYAMGRGSRLRMVLNRDDPSRSARMLGYYRAVGRLRIERIRTVERLAAQLTALRREAEGEETRLRRLAGHQTETRERLERAQAERGAIAADLDATIAQRRDAVVALQADAAALRELIEQLRRRVQIADEIDLTQAAFVTRKGQLHWPIEHAPLASRFRESAAAQDLHADGVMLSAAEGSEVRAVHHGRVVYADWLRGFGLLLVIDHGDGYLSLYGHNQALLTEVGEWVSAGEPIALSGASGGSGNTGLYFAIRHQGTPLDPERWCRGGQG